MTEPRDDETRPLPPAHGEDAVPPTAGEHTAPMPPVGSADAPAWASADSSEPAPPTTPAHPGDEGGSGVPDPVEAAGSGTGPHPAYAPVSADGGTTDGALAARSRWSGRKTAAVVGAALAIGALGAVGAAAAVTQSSGSGIEQDGRGQLPGGGQGRLPGGELPGDGDRPGRGGVPGGPPPGGFDHDGDGDHHGPGDHDGDGGDRLPAPDGGSGSTDPGDANGTDTALAT